MYFRKYFRRYFRKYFATIHTNGRQPTNVRPYLARVYLRRYRSTKVPTTYNVYFRKYLPSKVLPGVSSQIPRYLRRQLASYLRSVRLRRQILLRLSCVFYLYLACLSINNLLELHVDTQEDFVLSVFEQIASQILPEVLLSFLQLEGYSTVVLVRVLTSQIAG